MAEMNNDGKVWLFNHENILYKYLQVLREYKTVLLYHAVYHGLYRLNWLKWFFKWSVFYENLYNIIWTLNLIGENKHCFLIRSVIIRIKDYFLFINILASKKKPRTFDFMEMFKEAKQTALERNQGTW